MGVQNSMKILHINNNELIGGAAIAANRIIEAERKAGVDPYYFVRVKNSNSKDVYEPFGIIERVQSIISSRLDKRIYNNKIADDKWTTWSAGLYGLNLKRIAMRYKPDIIHLHWINAGLIDIKSIGELDIPVVWTIHDCWPFTGGCHYFDGCEGYKLGCCNCSKVLKKYIEIPENIVKRKMKSWKGKQLTIVSPSHWLFNKAKESLVLSNFDVRVIPNCIDSEKFQPIAKLEARKEIGLHLGDYSLILFIGPLNIDTVKGGLLLKKALKKLNINKKVCLLNPGNTTQENIGGIQVLPFNFFPAKKMNLVYSAADVLVLPSIQENLANTVLESLFCGTPVVAFDIGGNSDMIISGKNGDLVKPYSTESLATGLKQVLEKKIASSFEIIEDAKLRFGYDIISKRYIKLYKSIIKQ